MNNVILDSARRILVVDDDNDFLMATKECLESGGFAVKCAIDGESALALAREWRPHVIILDVMMKSDTEGIEISRKIRLDQHLKKIPVIMVTGIRLALGLSEGLKKDDSWLPVSAIFEKPVPPARLVEEIEKLLAVPAQETQGSRV